MRISARGVLVLLAACVSGLAFAAPAAAQPCVPFVCSLVLDCDQGAASCSDEGCICRSACNRHLDCEGDEVCANNLCIGRQPEPCGDNSHCPDGQICDASGACFAPCNRRAECAAGQVCANGRCAACRSDRDCDSDESCSDGLCEVRPVSTPEPQCTSNRQCDDGYPCNGEEFCDASVCRSGPRPCTAEPPMTARCVVDPPGSGCFHCELTARVDRPFEGEIVVDEPVTLPPGVGPGIGPGRGPDRPDSGGLPPSPEPPGGRGFTARGVLHAPLAARPPLDLASGRLRIVLTDPQGLALFDRTVEPGQWTGDAERGYSFRGVRVAPTRRKDAWQVEIEGVLPAAAKRFGRAARPVLALSIEWKGAAATVAVAELADCSRAAKNGRQTLTCRTKKLGG